MTWRAVAVGFVVALGCGCGGAKSTSTPPSAPTIAVTPVGAVRGSPVETMVPTAGAKLTSADGRLTVDVPADALAAPQTLTVQSIGNEAPGGVGLAYRLGPEGTTFAKPVTVTFSTTDDDLVGSDAATLDVGYQDAMGQWNALKAATRDAAGKTISVVTSHFSDWSLLEGFQLRPSTSVIVTGGQVDLEVYGCSNRVAGTDELAELRYVCRPDPELFVATQWTANGVVGGSPSVGTLGALTDVSATFTAPATTPANNPIAVSAASTQTSRGKIVLTANVFVDDYPAMRGTVSSTQKEDPGFTLTMRADVTMVWDKAQGFYVVGPGSKLTAHWDIVGPTCETHGLFMKDLAPNDGTVIVLELGYFPTGAATGTFTGTTKCAGTTEAFALTKEVEWWPSPVDSLLGIKPGYRMDDGFVDRVLASGKLVSGDWLLVPVLK